MGLVLEVSVQAVGEEEGGCIYMSRGAVRAYLVDEEGEWSLWSGSDTATHCNAEVCGLTTRSMRKSLTRSLLNPCHTCQALVRYTTVRESFYARCTLSLLAIVPHLYGTDQSQSFRIKI